ncbi:hypothetical protein BJF79_15840 [Actinomadura sp. CNU-125]|nr:hypothetical protein BJF79_15840 [Actinomadura sp. CNU-125]
MLAQPRGEGARAAIGQDIDPTAGLDIDEHGGVGMGTPQSEVVHPQHPRRRHRLQRNPQQDL